MIYCKLDQKEKNFGKIQMKMLPFSLNTYVCIPSICQPIVQQSPNFPGSISVILSNLWWLICFTWCGVYGLFIWDRKSDSALSISHVLFIWHQALWGWWSEPGVLKETNRFCHHEVYDLFIRNNAIFLLQNNSSGNVVIVYSPLWLFHSHWLHLRPSKLQT